MTYPYTLPDLERRFLPNKNWQVATFNNAKTKHEIHYSSALIQNPIGTIICLPGLSEFGEKYIETANFFNDQGYNFYVIDWAYQGRSTRHQKNPHKRSSDGYATDISDLNYFINNIVKTNTPLYMLGHSMGGHIGLRYLATQPHAIKSASFSAPMLGIKSLRFFPNIFRFLFYPFHDSYVPGGKNWHEEARKNKGLDHFSSDILRGAIHHSWSSTNPDLQIGNATLKWVSESLKSISFLRKKSTLEQVSIPALLASAGQDELVDNCAIKRAVMLMKNAKLLELPKAKHEILMETDDIRDQFLNETLNLFSGNH